MNRFLIALGTVILTCLSGCVDAGHGAGEDGGHGPGEFFDQPRIYLLQVDSTGVTPSPNLHQALICATTEQDDALLLTSLTLGTAVPATAHWDATAGTWTSKSPLALPSRDCVLGSEASFDFRGSTVEVVGPLAFRPPYTGPLGYCGYVNPVMTASAARFSGSLWSGASVWQVQADDPLGFEAQVSPALVIGAAASLVPVKGGPAVALVPALTAAGLTGAFSAPVLPLSTAFVLHTEAPGACGADAPVDAEYFTPVVSGELPQDGFESESVLGFGPQGEGAPYRISAEFAGVPPIAGERSFLVERGFHAVYFRLGRTGSQHRVVLTLRQLSESGATTMNRVVVTAGAVGSAAATVLAGLVSGEAFDGGVVTVAAPVTLELEVGTAGEEVVLEVLNDEHPRNFAEAMCTWGTPKPGPSALLLDDIHLE